MSYTSILISKFTLTPLKSRNQKSSTTHLSFTSVSGPILYRSPRTSLEHQCYHFLPRLPSGEDKDPTALIIDEQYPY